MLREVLPILINSGADSSKNKFEVDLKDAIYSLFNLLNERNFCREKTISTECFIYMLGREDISYICYVVLITFVHKDLCKLWRFDSK